MKNFLRILVFFSFCTLSLKAQKPDNIYKVNSDVIRAYNILIRNRAVSYRLTTLRNAPIFKLSVDSIFKIQYANGRIAYYQIQKISIPPLRNKLPILQLPVLKSKSPYRERGNKSDVILTQEQRLIECEILEAGTKDLKYYVITDPNKKVHYIKRKHILGYEKNLPVQPPATPVTVAKAEVKKINSSQMPTAQKPTDNYHSITFNAEGAYIPQRVSPQWAADQIGLGLRQGIGGSVSYNRRIIKWAGLFISTGYMQWETERQYKENDVIIYNSTDKLQRIPLQLGVKIYPAHNFYLMPQISAQWVTLSGTTSETHIIPSLNSRQNTLYFGLGGDFGFEFSGKKMITDIGIGFSVLPKKTYELTSFYSLTNRLSFFSIRAGIGFVKYKNAK